ncbi:ABC transporter permease, partial [bacterium]|nr:ABC transporter permease [candidate division CSSED10-310 bacterium]
MEMPVMVPDAGNPDLEQLGIDVLVHWVSTGDGRVAHLFYDSAADRSIEAKERLERIFDQYCMVLLSSHVLQRPAEMPKIRTIEVDLASKESRSRFLLGILLPMIIVIITVMGGLYPSIEVITSERERKTIETTLVAPVNETGLIVGKFSAVIAMSMLAGILNIIAMILTLRHTLFSGVSADIEFSIPWTAIPLILFGILLIGATFNALMILIAAFAEDFKEAQSLISPVYAIGIQPAVVAAIPGIPFNAATALIPVTNVSLMFRALIQGNLEWLPACITLGSLLVWCLALLYIARLLIRRDAVVLGLNRNQLASLIRIPFRLKGVRS